jgi:GNAT superfamily N-acetyltransferase
MRDTPHTPITDVDDASALERIEAEAWGDVHRAASGRAAELSGARVLGIGSATACIASRIDVLAFNRVLGLGLDGPVTGSDVDELVSEYARVGCSRFFVQLFPGVETQVAEKLRQRGFRIHNRWVKLWRGIDAPLEADTSLRIEQIGAEHADAFATIASDCLGWPEAARPWIELTVGRPHWLHYLAFDGDTPVATAALYASRKIGWIDFAATLPSHRGRGAQGALLARRITDAAARGVKRLTVETAEITTDHDSPSYRNVGRHGFRVAYTRPNYILDLRRDSVRPSSD